MAAIIEQVSEMNMKEVEAYLCQHDETTQFLINNMREHGPLLTDHPNSGNFKLVRDQGQVAAVFCLARRGNLIVQSDGNYASMILDHLKKQPVPLKGFIGEWASIEPIWKKFKTENSNYSPSYELKEILYSYKLQLNDVSLVHDGRVRLLTESDFPQWLQFTRDYTSELSLPDDLTDDQKRQNFLAQTRAKVWWGLFDGPHMRSRTGLNSKGETIGQVGGVFTPKQFRKKGYAKATMLHMMRDCRDIHGHQKTILFTGETDIPAQKLYESIGYKRIGSFALIL